MNNYSSCATPASIIELLSHCLRKVPAIASMTLALFLMGGMSTAQAAKFNCSITSVSPADPTVGEAVTFEGTATDGGSPYNFTWDFGDGSSSVDTGVAEGGTSSVTNTYAAADTYTVTMTVNGKLNGRKQSTCKLKGQLPTATVVVGPAGGNNPPVVTNPGTQTNDEGDAVSLSINATDDDPGDTLTYSAASLPANLTINANTGLISGSVATGAATNSPYSVTVDVSDGTDTGSVTFLWNVNAVVGNNPPNVTNPGTQTNNEGDTVSLQVIATDDPGDTLTYSAPGLPANLAINANTGQISGTVATGAAANSPYTVTVDVSDGTDTTQVSFLWNVNAVVGNNPPNVTNPGTQTNNEGDTVSLPINATDDPGDILDYSASGLPANLVIDASTGLISGTVATGAAANSPYSVMVNVSDGTDTTPVTFQWVVNVNVADCNPATTDVSINTTSQSGCPDAVIQEQTIVSNDTPAPDGNTYSVLAVNDLGMHCGDLDTRISSILPPFQVLLGQVIQKGSSPTLNPAGVSLEYSAASNLNDPASDPVTQSFPGLLSNGSTYKTNFWNTVINTGVYNAFYPFDINGMMTEDLGLPVPNVKTLYINGAGNVVPGGTGIIEAVQHAMPGIVNPYGGDNLGNDPQAVQEHYDDKPFFVGFPFGYVAENVNWYEGAGIPFAAYDDYGRENAYPLVRVEAKLGTATVSTVDTVLPISGEASCTNCHTTLDDYVSVHGDGTKHRTSEPTLTLSNANLPVAISVDDEEDMPPMVSLEYAADINVLRLHDFRHGNKYVNTSCDTAGVNCLNDPDIHDPCTINQANPNGSSSCLTHKALEQGKPVVCQVCHYTPALDLAQVGPMAGAPGTGANGRNQVAHSSNSNVMHGHHGTLEESPGNLLFKTMPAPNQLADGTITNQGERLDVLEETCYQCHPGTNVQCLRGAMFNGGMLCNDCHGDMQQVGADFSAGVSPATPGAFVLDQGNYYDPDSSQPRVPWANEPGCGSCHTGTATNNLAGSAGTLVNTRDIDNNVDGIRLRQAYRSGDAKATPIVPTNKRFAEPAVPASFNGFDNPGAGNPQLYRVSTGHGGVMCEGCHGATHAEWPNGNPNANDNVAADQLQGHVGAIIECDTCHTNVNNLSLNGSLSSLQGPHGLHAVGNTNFARGDHDRNINKNACRECHGQNGQGTVLSRMAEDRVLECKDRTTFCPNETSVLFPKGHAVGCVECHENQL